MAKLAVVELPDPDPAQVCYKCQAEDVSTTYHERPMIGGTGCAEFVKALGDEIGEHLCRRCRVCGYLWCTKVAGEGPSYTG